MNRVGLTFEGDKFIFDETVSTPTFNLMTSKLHWNSVIATPGTKYLVVYVKNFYLNNLIPEHKYYKITLILIPQDVIDKYNLMDKQINVFLYIQVDKGMYGLFQVGIITHTLLK